MDVSSPAYAPDPMDFLQQANAGSPGYEPPQADPPNPFDSSAPIASPIPDISNSYMWRIEEREKRVSEAYEKSKKEKPKFELVNK